MSIRNSLIETLVNVAEMELECTNSVTDEDEVMDGLFEDVVTLSTFRYLQVGDPVPKSNVWLTEILPRLDKRRFKVMMRVTRKQFKVVLRLITDNPIFHGHETQLPVAHQLAITLYRLGACGTGCSLARQASMFGVGDGGTILRVTKRVFKAILDLEPKYLNWPAAEERDQITEEVGDNFPQCVGFLDGSEFNLYEAPGLDHTSYYSRKQKYSIKAQAVCDYDLRIRYLHVGFPGSVHDARIFANSDLGRNISKYLKGEQWLAADSAYKLTSTVITPFRKNSTFKSKRDRDRFNKYLSSYRVKIEQCFGILKQKFSSLKELRVRVKDPDGHRQLCLWIKVCVILHNILLPYYKEDDFEYVPEIDDGEDDVDPGDGSAGPNKRAALFSLLERKFE